MLFSSRCLQKSQCKNDFEAKDNISPHFSGDGPCDREIMAPRVQKSRREQSGWWKEATTRRVLVKSGIAPDLPRWTALIMSYAKAVCES
ncbi:hypothetical protein RRG08_052710 [Elysia crispata]|uniref:Uncharacterized protein n=1 Tax=Elysia crispata TaxID=231223 RepID=A0AAE1B634_9GAST|nr:hypothetical protein RRG08_052710 [Elysia crispata]